MRRRTRGARGRYGPVPPSCQQPECFDELLRSCVACRLLRTPGPSPACTSSPAPRMALRPLESAGSEPGAALRLPALLFGAPAGLGLALALVLLALVTWMRRRRGAAPTEARDAEPEEPPDSVVILSPGPREASAPAWPPPAEDPASSSPAHSVPVPATELGSTELVTTKTAGPEQQ